MGRDEHSKTLPASNKITTFTTRVKARFSFFFFDAFFPVVALDFNLLSLSEEKRKRQKIEVTVSAQLNEKFCPLGNLFFSIKKIKSI